MIRIYSITLLSLALIGIFPSNTFAEKAKALIHATREGSYLSGEVNFEEVIEGLKITATLQDAPVGKHGFHIHEFGACTDDGKAAGGHFNPYGKQHGFLLTDRLAGAHAGDLGNIEISAEGTGMLEIIIPGLTISKRSPSVAGRAVVLHELEDDFGQPTGNAGARIGCGTIVVTEN